MAHIPVWICPFIHILQQIPRSPRPSIVTILFIVRVLK